MVNENNSYQTPLDDYRWLVSQRAEPWLNRAAEDKRSTLNAAQSLRRDLSSGRVHLVLEQVELRRRATKKFADAARMFFTRVGLEQATDQVVASYKASRFPAGGVCVDLCCGLGGDLAALAGRAPALGVDRDRIAAILAAANLRVRGAAADVVIADVERFKLPNGACWHLDPDRRPGGRRTSQPQWHSPDLASIELLLENSPHGAVKLAPAADVHRAWIDRAELEWISRRRECRQLVVWLGDLAKEPGERRATVLKADGFDAEPEAYSLAGRPRVPIPTADNVDRFLIEPDPAVLAADLTGELAARHGLARLAPGSVYLTDDRPVVDPLAACFEVEEVLPFDRKRLKRLLARRGIPRLEIKQRGMAIDPNRLRRELGMGGARSGKDDSAVLFLAKQRGGSVAVLARRTTQDSTSNNV